MPVPLRSSAAQRAEAKYNVTTEFPSLGLHSAAATGNVGLVEYALDRGQPVNSVLDGVLPLHAAAAGGNVQVVKLLIDHGADVNAPRLPRRYSNDKNRDSSAPIVGTSGSTPLHFAAANGNYEVISLLLLRGAHADRADKYGVTPEMLARQNRWLECADLLRQWMVNKDRDLRERPGGVDDRLRQQTRVDSGGNDDPHTSSLARRRLHVKQSFDTALSRLKPTSSVSTNPISTPPASPSRPFADTSDHASYSADMDCPDQNVAGQRRPSLPHIMQPSLILPRSRKTSTPNITGTNTPQRPGSSGGPTENTDQESNQGSARAPAPRKLGSKLSLMNLFKKSQSSESGQVSDSSLSLSSSTGANPPNPSTGTPSAEATVSAPSIPRLAARDVPDIDSTPQPQTSPKASATTRSPVRPPPVPLAVDLHNAMISQRQAQSQGSPSRDRSMSIGSTKPGSSQDGIAASAPCSSPLARMFRSKNHNRDRSGSGASLGGYKEEKSFDSTSTGQDDSFDTAQVHSPSKPSILKLHGRSPSGGPLNSSPGPRALRFDSSSTNGSNRSTSGYGNGANRGLRICNSAGSLSRYQSVGPLLYEGDSDDEDFGQEEGRSPASNSQNYDGYPTLLETDESSPQTQAKSPRIMLLTRDRGLSITSASDISLSPILANEERITSRLDMFPFDINKPPLLEPDEQEPPDPNHLQVPEDIEARGRGDSVSSASTVDSQNNPALSMSGTTSGSGGSDTINTLLLSPDNNTLPISISDSPTNGVKGRETTRLTPPITPDSKGTSKASPRRTHIPPEINIDAISSHAQAEALVQRTQQDIFDIASSNEVTPATSNLGLSPLSARLAAYGESLALERKFREQKSADALRTSSSSRSPHSQASTLPEIIMTEDGGILNSGPVTRNGVGRQHSLEHRSGQPRKSPKPRAPKRPSTAEGVTPRREDQLFFSREGSGRSGHHVSHSASGFSTSPSSRLASYRDINDTLWGERQAVSPPIVDPPPISRSLNVAPSMPMRSRTPVGPLDGQLSRISSLDSPDLSTDFSPLARVTSTPLVPSRTAKSSVKLAKMGFPANSGQAPLTPSKKPFSLRGIVQTLKGKP